MATVDAELQRSMAAARLPVTRPRELAAIRVALTRVLDLRSGRARRALGVTLSDLTDDDPSVAQAIGEAAQHLGYEAIVAPSATGTGDVIAIFLMNRAPESSIELVETREYVPKAGVAGPGSET